MCGYCELGNRLQYDNSKPRWWHFLNRIILVVTILAAATWIIGG